MSDFELTDAATDALISSAIGGALLLAISSIGGYGPIMAGFFGVGLFVIGMFGLWGIWEENANNPILSAIFIVFGVFFEYGAITDIAAVMPICIVVDIIIFIITFLYKLAELILSFFGIGLL